MVAVMPEKKMFDVIFFTKSVVLTITCFIRIDVGVSVVRSSVRSPGAESLETRLRSLS